MAYSGNFVTAEDPAVTRSGQPAIPLFRWRGV